MAFGWITAFTVIGNYKEAPWQTVWSGIGYILLQGVAPLSWLFVRNTPEECGLLVDGVVKRSDEPVFAVTGYALRAASRARGTGLLGVRVGDVGLRIGQFGRVVVQRRHPGRARLHERDVLHAAENQHGTGLGRKLHRGLARAVDVASPSDGAVDVLLGRRFVLDASRQHVSAPDALRRGHGSRRRRDDGRVLHRLRKSFRPAASRTNSGHRPDADSVRLRLGTGTAGLREAGLGIVHALFLRLGRGRRRSWTLGLRAEDANAVGVATDVNRRMGQPSGGPPSCCQ